MASLGLLHLPRSMGPGLSFGAPGGRWVPDKGLHVVESPSLALCPAASKTELLSIVQEAQTLSCAVILVPQQACSLKGERNWFCPWYKTPLKMHVDLRFSFLQHILKCQKDKWCSLLNVSAVNSLKKKSIIHPQGHRHVHTHLHVPLPWMVCPPLFHFHEQRFGGEWGESHLLSEVQEIHLFLQC